MNHVRTTYLISPTMAVVIIVGVWILLVSMIKFTSVGPVIAEDKAIIIDFPVAPLPEKVDKRLTVLQNYLSQFNSPLKEHAQDFLDAADNYGVDWRLIPAIAGVESTFGKSIPGGHDPEYTSYNGWGWGVYGSKVTRFNSWREAIFAVTKGVKIGYLNQGLTDPAAMNKKYASSPVWGEHVTYFLSDLDGYVNEHNFPDQFIYRPPDLDSEAIFQNDAYLKVDQDHLETQLVE